METFTQQDQIAVFSAQALAGRSVLVVGAGQAVDPTNPTLTGNGRAISLALARMGAFVHCADRDEAAADATTAAVRAVGGRGQAIVGDVAEPGQCRRLVEEAVSHRPLNGLVLNVGISNRKSLSELTAESWDAIFQVNLRGHMLCAQAALPFMQPGGSVVFISSLAAHMAAGRNPAYESSKAALSALCRAVALEGHSRDIRANVVSAGLVDTPMGRAASRATPTRAQMPVPFGRQASAWDIASAVAFVMSDAARYVNAIELPVDGGLRHGIARSPSPAN